MIFHESIPRLRELPEYNELVKTLEKNNWIQFLKKLVKGVNDGKKKQADKISPGN